jgi:hypothetical protein
MKNKTAFASANPAEARGFSGFYQTNWAGADCNGGFESGTQRIQIANA